jgi:hypothetical protein
MDKDDQRFYDDVEDIIFGFVQKCRSFSKWRRRWRMRLMNKAKNVEVSDTTMML